jgi:predicted DCC family thiol-disulfide oxidoreductase YuxK
MWWVEPAGADRERIFVRSTAALRLARYLGGVWRVLLLGYLVPRSLRDRLYDFIARHRHQLPGSRPNCLVIPDAQRGRFLD